MRIFLYNIYYKVRKLSCNFRFSTLQDTLYISDSEGKKKKSLSPQVFKSQVIILHFTNLPKIFPKDNKHPILD